MADKWILSEKSLNDRIHDALAPLGMPATEAPMEQSTEGGYIAWEKGAARRIGASGGSGDADCCQTVFVTLYATQNDDHEQLLQRMRKLLMEAGALSAWVSGRAWQDTMNRRECTMTLKVLCR